MSRKETVINVFVALILAALAGCSRPLDRTLDRPADDPKVQIVSAAQAEAGPGVSAEIMPVLEVLFRGSAQERLSLVQYVTVGCTTADGLGGPPKCAAGEAAGTLVEVFPIGGAEGYFVRPDEVERALEFTVVGLYAVYRPEPGVDPVEYWPVGEYALLFESQMNNLALPVTAFVQDGKLVRLGFASHPMDPAESLSGIPLDRILISPEDAKTLTGQAKSPS